MRTLLLAGTFQNALSKYGLDIINHENLTVDEVLLFLQQNQPNYDQIIITDEAMFNSDFYTVNATLRSIMLLQEKENNNYPVLLLTNNVLLQEINISGVEIHFYNSVRINISHYLNYLGASNKNGADKSSKKGSKGNALPTTYESVLLNSKESIPKTAKKNIIERFKKNKTMFFPESSSTDKAFTSISCDISRVIAISGCRGSGVTSTAVNLAHIASQKGLSTMLIDLDIMNCALNLYFCEYYDTAEREHDIAFSLIRNLAKPQDYKLNTYSNGNLYLTTLAYSFHDTELLKRFYSGTKLINMLTVFRKHFQLCILDMPFDVIGKLSESILYIDSFGICLPNNLYAITGALRAVQSLFVAEDLESLFSKSKIIVSKFNEQSTIHDDFFAPETVCELLLELSDNRYTREFELAGYIPYTTEFDSQLETDIPISTSNARLNKAYTDVLLRMIKGVF
ncbi:MAG: AAA family ATPase [Firmicutes bacterium]|nr:AAA family ATPase [Bacillota bacterium]